MKSLGRVLVRTNTFVSLPALLLPGLLVVGCVSLTKPNDVEKYCSTGSASTCLDNYVLDAYVTPSSGPDANDDVGAEPSPDLPYADEPVVSTKDDVGPDLAVTRDNPPDEADAAVDNNDVTGTDAPNAVEADRYDVASPPADLGDLEPDSPPDMPTGTDVGQDLQPDLGLDLGPDILGSTDVPPTACPAVNPVSGKLLTFDTKSAVCFVTCDFMDNGWGCSSFTTSDRTIKINGTTMAKCGDPLPAKKTGGYYYFEIGAGKNTWDAIWWSGPPVTSCPTPSGGFSP